MPKKPSPEITPEMENLKEQQNIEEKNPDIPTNEIGGFDEKSPARRRTPDVKDPNRSPTVRDIEEPEPNQDDRLDPNKNPMR